MIKSCYRQTIIIMLKYFYGGNDMNLIICIIGPAFISIKLFDYLNNNKLSIKDTLMFLVYLF